MLLLSPHSHRRRHERPLGIRLWMAFGLSVGIVSCVAFAVFVGAPVISSVYGIPYTFDSSPAALPPEPSPDLPRKTPG